MAAKKSKPKQSLNFAVAVVLDGVISSPIAKGLTQAGAEELVIDLDDMFIEYAARMGRAIVVKLDAEENYVMDDCLRARLPEPEGLEVA